MPNTILVTGATGTVGSALVENLAGAGVRARALVRSPNKAEGIEKLGHEAIIGDLDNTESLRRALEGVEKVFLLSAPEERQAELQSNLVRAAKEAGVSHVVKLSAIGVGGWLDPTPLGRLHRQVEEELEASGMAWTHLRPSGFMQNSFIYAPTIKAQSAFYAPGGDAAVGYVDARDIAGVALAALTGEGHQGKAYDITGPEALTNYDVARELSAALGREVKYVEVPLEAARAGMLGAGMSEWLADALVQLFSLYGEGRAGLVTDVVRETTGREPTTFAQFARDYAGAFE